MGEKPVKIIDAVGLYCPEPILRLSEAIEDVDFGDRVEILLDDPSGREDIERWAARTGNRIISYSEDGGEMRFVIEKR